ncbi:MAG: pyridoxamine 5'-phosphate oxidase family protein [Bacillota bacterium]
MDEHPVELVFESLRQEVEKILAQTPHLVLATAADNRVRARTMSHVNIGLEVYFQTGKGSTKYAQIAVNPRVALCLGNLQIEGVAEVLGHPLAEANREFCRLYRERHPSAYERYSSRPDEVVIRVRPILCTLWKYVDGRPCRELLDLEAERAFREYYL